MNRLNARTPRQKTRGKVAFRGYRPNAVFLSLILCLVFLTLCSVAQADEQWPPLNVVEQHESRTEQVNGVPFTHAYHSWWLPSYQIGKLHYVTSVQIGPHAWSVIIGVDGSASLQSNHNDKSTTPLYPPHSLTLPSLPQLPPVPVMSPAPHASLPPLSAMRGHPEPLCHKMR